MVQIDWGDSSPSRRQRELIQARVDTLSMAGPVIGLRKKGAGYEAQVLTPLATAPVELRLHGGDLASVVDRAVDLLTIVIDESKRANGDS